ncbi:MAG: ATP-binding protein, partial [Myxococcota bacterium]
SGEGFKEEVLNYHANGDAYWVDIEVRPLRDETGALTHFVAVQQDVTERRRAEADRAETLTALRDKKLRLEAQAKALRAARDEAMNASRVKSQFLANMSHEIRTPMNGVLGMLALAEQTDLPAEAVDYVQTARSSAEALLTIINDILDLSKIEAEKLEIERVPFRLTEELTALRGVFDAGARQRGLRLEFSVDAGVPSTVLGDPVRLRQVLTNLVGNALKFTSEGEVVVHVSTDPAAPGTHLRFAVRDTGVGIPEEKQKQVFAAFTQADGSTTRKYGGTGLGLAICARLVQLMGGELRVESAPGEGSTFSFGCRLPATDAVPAGRSHLPPKTPLPALHLLVAEDNAVNALVARKLLEKAGHRVTLVTDGREAVAAVREAPADFDACLMDMQMPEMDGLEATRAIRRFEHEEERPRIPIVALTANAMKGDDAACLAAGMDAYVTKPVRIKDVEDALRRVLERPLAA